MKKLFKWLLYGVGLITLFVVGLLAAAYWNRDKLLNKLTAELNKEISGNVSIEKIDFTFLHRFPHFSVTLQEVKISDRQNGQYQKNIFTADKIFLDLRLLPLLKKEVVISSLFIQDADVFLFKARNGDINTKIFQKPRADSTNTDNTTSNSIVLDLQDIDFRNVSVKYVDSTKNKLMSFRFRNTSQTFSEVDSGYLINIKGGMHFDSLYFNPKSGSYLTGKDIDVNLQIKINQLAHILAVNQSTVTYKKNKIVLSGNFELKKEGKYDLQFLAIKVNPSEAKELLNAKLIKSLSKFKIEDAATIKVNLMGRATPGFIPFADMDFETQQAQLRYGSLDFSLLTLKGSFTNHMDSLKARDNKNSKVTISSFKGVMEKFPVEGRVTFTELQDPTMNLHFTSRLSFKQVNEHLDNNRFVLSNGNFVTIVSYIGKVSEYLDPTRTKYEGILKGSLHIKQGALRYKPKKISLDQINLKCSFNEKAFTVQDLNLNVNGSAVTIKGNMQNFIPFFIQPKNKGYVKLTVQSPNFDLTSLAAKGDLDTKSKQQSKKNRKKMTDLLDRMYDKLEFDVDVSVGQLRFRKFTATNFVGSVKLDNNLLQANPISMNVASGKMNLNFSLRNLFDPISPMVISARLDKANIKELFLNFNNFNQKTIHADNLSGKISADVTFKANVDENYTVLAPSMEGSLDCIITDGGLKNFEPMENMSNFLFKKRDFSDVQFAELNSNFSIRGTDMDISRMEIQSSVLSLFLEGRYSFTDSTSLSVQLPLSNLKKRHKDFKPKNIGIHAKTGPSIYLHVYRDKDINSKIKIDYDPFKKWAKN
jgi:uncharacterized protein involved in outer membrane biogenesis